VVNNVENSLSTMLKLFVLGLAVALASSQTCSNNFGSYMNCIKDSIGGKEGFLKLEKEYQGELDSTQGSCFDNGSNGKSDHCALSNADFGTDAFGPQSVPLADCNTCKVIAKAVVSVITQVDRETAQCTASFIREKLADNLKPCVEATIGDFKLPPIPDFEEDGFDHKEVIQKTLSKSVNMNYALALCKAKNEAGFKQTNKCLNGKSRNPSSGPCSITGTCLNKQGQCSADVRAAHDRTCECSHEGAEKVQEHITKFSQELIRSVYTTKLCFIKNDNSEKCQTAKASVASIISKHSGEKQPDQCSDSSNQYGRMKPLMCACYWSLRDALRATNKYNNVQTDWYDMIGELQEKCIDKRGVSLSVQGQPQGQKFTIDSAIFWGCARIVQQSDEAYLRKATFDLWTGASFLGYLVDSVLERYTRFCPCY